MRTCEVRLIWNGTEWVARVDKSKNEKLVGLESTGATPTGAVLALTNVIKRIEQS